LPRRKLMLIVDAVLFLFIVLLNAPLFTGLQLHELSGICLVIPFSVHLLLSWKWIVHSTKHLFSQKDLKKRMNYLLNSMLFLLCILELASGLMISQFLVLYIGINTINDWKWRALHNQASVGIILTVSIHIAMNWLRIVSYFKKGIAGKQKKAVIF